MAYEGLVQLDANGKSTGKWNGQIKFVEEHLLDPLRWKKPKRIFVNSMSDLFHENVNRTDLRLILAVIMLCPQHTFQVLTKRPENMKYILTEPGFRSAVTATAAQLAFDLQSLKVYARIQKPSNSTEIVYDFGKDGDEAGCRVSANWPLPNLHLGVSVEDQKTADLRIPLLLQTPAAVRFISAEPLLGPVNLDSRPISFDQSEACGECGSQVGSQDFFTATVHCGNPECSSCGESLAMGRIDWVIVGGESGPGARPMHPDWARSLRDQCKAAGVPFFFKQWGEWAPWEPRHPVAGVVHLDTGGDQHQTPYSAGWNGRPMGRVGTKAAGCLLDGVEHHEFPAVTA